MKANSRSDVIDFTRGVMDRIRDHIREHFPDSLVEVDKVKTSISEKTTRRGDRVMVIKNARK